MEQHSACPSDETLAAFIDGRLDEETRKRVVAHAADCEVCYGTVMASRAWEANETDSTVEHLPIARRNFQYGLIGAAAALAVFLLLQPATARYREWHDQKALRTAANELPERPIESRLSLDLEYRRFVQHRGPSTEDSGNPELLQAFDVINDANDTHPTAATHHSLGLACLLLGDYAKAVTELSDAVEQQTSKPDIHAAIAHCDDVKLLNDLSAAFESRASHTDEPSVRALAQQAAERALQIDRRSTIAAWNLAVAIERNGSRSAAVSAWSDYLRLDPTSAWSTEAIDRRRRLQD